MAHRLVFQVEVELEREEGKFASRDEMADAIVEWLEAANEQSIDGIGADGESTYEVTAWDVAEVEESVPESVRLRKQIVAARKALKSSGFDSEALRTSALQGLVDALVTR